MVMPGMPSADMATAIREMRPAARWLFMSGYSEHAAIHPLLLRGAVPFLEKPFAPAGLARKVREVLDTPRTAA